MTLTVGLTDIESREALFETSHKDAVEILAHLDRIIAMPWRIHTYLPDREPFLVSPAED
ncbi:hypothetical protein [Gymnodinialimonas hymeniacidonis]|uniref:hypothetical protein n=1 Tax=Gymnodinialimonas hymeniacidonis TaxID=3126508 RepID=UPI0034C61C63